MLKKFVNRSENGASPSSWWTRSSRCTQIGYGVSYFQLQNRVDKLMGAVDFEANGISKQVNAVQKEIAAKKKVRTRYRAGHSY